MTSHSQSPAESTVDLRNRWLAAGLALLLPGLGHLYQRRHFKAGVYFFCILGLFFTGQALGEWKVVYLGDSETAGRFGGPGNNRLVGRLLQGYGAQFPVGAFAWPAMIQSRRYHDEANDDTRGVEEPFSSTFEGAIVVNTLNGPQRLAIVRGTISLEPADGRTTGKIVGTTEDGQPVELTLSRVDELGKPVSANEWRSLNGELESLPKNLKLPDQLQVAADSDIYITGRVPRPFLDRYQVPLGKRGEETLTAELGGQLEIAYVITWIAGLLNVLAIWDALDGPAYGYGNEPDLKRKSRRRRDDSEKDTESSRRPEPAANPV